MKCPFCGHTEDRVVDSRVGRDGEFIRRRRACLKCHRRYTTYEYIEDVLPHVVKRDGRREPFDHEKLVRGVREAFEKRSVPATVIDNLVDEIEKQLQDTGEKEVESAVVAEEVLIKLSEIDGIAYVRYAARYKNYGDLREVADELNAMLDQKSGAGRGS